MAYKVTVFRTACNANSVGSRPKILNVTVDVAQLVNERLKHEPDRYTYLAAYGIPPHVISNVLSRFAAGISPNDILAVVCARSSKDGEHGVVIARQGLLYELKNGQPAVRIPWNDIRGGMFYWFTVEIVLNSYQRVYLDESVLCGDSGPSLELIINGICGG